MIKTVPILLLCLALAACQSKDTKAPEPEKPTDRITQDVFRRPVYNRVSLAGFDTLSDIAADSTMIMASVSGATGMSNGGYSYASYPTASATARSDKQDQTPPPANNAVKNTDPHTPKQFVKNATLRFDASNDDSAHTLITQAIEAHGGSTVIDRRTQTPEDIEHSMQIRVGPADFDRLIADIMKASIYTHVKDISADDMTAQYVDMELRLRSKKEVERRYTDLLSRAQRINDIIVIESNRRAVQEEIEAMEGNLRLLKDQVAYSTIYLTFTQKLKEPKPIEPVKTEKGFWERTKRAFRGGADVISTIFLLLLSIWPLVIIGALIALWMKRVQRRKDAEKAAEPGKMQEPEEKEEEED